MSNRGVTIVSTTDTPEQVAAALADDVAPVETSPVSQIVDHSTGGRFEVPGDSEDAGEKELKTEAKPAETAEKAADTPPDAGQKPKPGKRNDPQARIDEVTFKWRETERQRDAKDAELAQERQERLRLQREMEALRATHAEPKPAEAGSDGSADQEPAEDQFETFDAYFRAVVDYRAEKKAAAAVEQALAADRERIARAQQEHAINETKAAHQKRWAAGREKYPDFAEVVETADLPISPVMVKEIVESPVGHEIAYYLGKHPEECQRIHDLPPDRTLVALGMIQARLEAAPSEPGPAPVARPVETAPPAFRPVAGGSHASAGDDDALPMSAWIRKQNERDRAAGRL